MNKTDEKVVRYFFDRISEKIEAAAKERVATIDQEFSIVAESLEIKDQLKYWIDRLEEEFKRARGELNRPLKRFTWDEFARDYSNQDELKSLSEKHHLPER